MNGNAVIDMLMQRCGNRQDTELRSIILSELVLAQQTSLEQGVLLPWFLVKDTNVAATNLTWAAYLEYTALPDDFLGFDDDLGCSVWIQDPLDTSTDPWLEIARRPYPSMKAFSRNASDDSTVSPYMFDIVGTSMYFRPIQTAASTVRLIYLAADPDAPVDAASSNLWLTNAPDLLIAVTGVALTTLGYVTDPEIAKGFASAEIRAVSRIMAKNEAWKHQLQNYSMGD